MACTVSFRPIYYSYYTFEQKKRNSLIYSFLNPVTNMKSRPPPQRTTLPHKKSPGSLQLPRLIRTDSMSINHSSMNKIKNVLKWMYHSGAIASGIDTALVVFSLMMLATAQFAPAIQIFVSAAFTLFAVFVLDFSLHSFLEDTFKGIASGEAKQHRKLYAYLFVVSIGFGLGTIAVTMYARHTVAHTVVGAARTIDVATPLAAFRKDAAQQVQSIEANQSAIRSQMKRAEANAGSPQLRNLASGGNAWATAELAKARAKARKPFEAQLAEATDAKTTLLLGNQNTEAQIAANITQANDLAIQRNEAQRQAVSWLQMVFAIGGTVLMFVSAVGTALLYNSYSIGTNPLEGITKKKRIVQTTQEPPAPVETPSNLQQPGPPAARPIGFHNNFTDEAVTPVTAAVTSQPVTPVNPVITATLEGLQLNCEFDGVKVYDSPVTGKIVTVLQNNSQLDRTKLRQYISIYGKRAVESKGQATRETNLKKANVFRAALKDIYNETL